MKLITKSNYETDSVLSIKIENKVVNNNCIVSILLPKKLCPFYLQIETKPKKYFKELIRKYKSLLLNDTIGLKEKKSINLGYQEKGQSLKKFSLEIESDVWAELKVLRFALNWSICKILSFLISLDQLGIVENFPESIGGLVVPKKTNFYFIGRFYFSTKKSIFYRRVTYKRKDFH